MNIEPPKYIIFQRITKLMIFLKQSLLIIGIRLLVQIAGVAQAIPILYAETGDIDDTPEIGIIQGDGDGLIDHIGSLPDDLPSFGPVQGYRYR